MMMILFIWQRVDEATDAWHKEGGCVAVAASIARAKELLAEKGANIHHDEPPYYTCELRGCTGEQVWIMRDTGCC